MQDVILEVKHLSKSFGSNEVLKDIDFTVKKGDVTSIIGASGSGKSTLLRCINLLETPTSGEILYHGENVAATGFNATKYRSHVGMVFQSFNLFNNMTVLENCIVGQVKVLKKSREEARANALNYLQKVGMAPYIKAKPRQISGGQKQRVAIARALASDPEVLLCDEATSALDPMTTQSILALLKDINERLGITVVIITHEMAVIRQICTRVAILDGGQIVEEGSVDEVFVHTRSAAGKRLFGILPENEDEDRPPVPALRIVFDGGMENQPVIADLVRQCNVDVNILSANIRRLNDKPYGQMLIEMPGDDAARRKIVTFLTEKGLTVKEVWPQ